MSIAFPPSIRDYYGAAIGAVEKEVNSAPDDEAAGRDQSEWTDFLVDKHSLEPIVIDPAREMTITEISTHYGPGVRVDVPVIPTGTIEVIVRNGLVGGPVALGVDYKKEYIYDPNQGTLGMLAPQDASRIAHVKDTLLQRIRDLNAAIEQANQTFPAQVRQVCGSKQQAVKAKHQRLDELSKAVGIRLIKKAELSHVIPTAVRVRQKIAPLIPPKPTLPSRPALSQENFTSILDLLDNQCRQFERTPTVFQGLSEEALRDIILSSLNAVFEGAATGETFRGIGKVDIHLPIAQGEVFVAECKNWTGPAALAEVVRQVLERLSWREAYGVAVLFSRNADFGHVLHSIERALATLPASIPGSARRREPHHFVGRFALPSDASSQVEIHVIAFNLYAARSSAGPA